MGYGYYIIDGKECGYLVDDVCNQKGCEIKIDRGLGYACGGTPGEVDDSCDGYFCGNHLFYVEANQRHTGEPGMLCGKCLRDLHIALAADPSIV